MIDLHTHSIASDGTYTPAELIQKAAQAGISVLALTDHDTVAGIPEALRAGRRYGVTVLTGIEISVTWQPGELHLLGLGIDTTNTQLHALIRTVQKKRSERNEAIIDKFKKEGIAINRQDLEGIAQGGVIGRPHFARYLVSIKKAKSIQAAFNRYLGKGRPCCIPKEGSSLAEAIAIVKHAGGVPILAHPMSLYLSWAKLPIAIADFKVLGLEGLEAWHSGARYSECVRLEALAQSLGLIVTAGSDFHGETRKDRRLGRTVNGIPIEDRFYTENLLPALKQTR